MARRGREDQPGSWHQVINRGIAKRPLFETRDYIRFFLSRIAREVREERIEVHAFCVLTTHFHFLVRNPRGELSDVFRRAQNAHSRRFNGRRRRDGALVRGRFFSKPARDDRYRSTLVHYIAHNPVKARVVRRAEDYEFGSARYDVHGYCPPWLERSWVRAEVSGGRGWRASTASAAERDELVERRLASRASRDPLADLVACTPPFVRLWMERKSRLADGHKPGLPVCTYGSLRRAIGEGLRNSGLWQVRLGKLTKAGHEIATVGLARDLAGYSFAELAERTEWSTMQLRRMAEIHRELVSSDSSYLGRASRVGAAAIDAILGRGLRD